MKFGGTSVADAEAIRRVGTIVERRWLAAASGPPVVVVSALAGVTDGLMDVVRDCERGDAVRVSARLAELTERHLAVASELTSGARRDAVLAAVRDGFARVARLGRARALRRTVSPRSIDAIAASGELVGSRIVAAALEERGLPAAWIDARTVMVTNREHTRAVPDMSATRARACACVAPVIRRGAIVVVGGFIGATPLSVTTTLGRGGSDYSAAILGACLAADEIQIWTDVDGMLTADPRVIEHARLVERLSFAEAAELAYFGAKVLHPRTLRPASIANIPVRVLNSRRPYVTGTLITADGGQPDGRLAGLACKRDVTVVDITSAWLFSAHEFLRRLFEAFDHFDTPVDVVTMSEVSVSVTIDDTRHLDAIAARLGRFAEVSVERRMAIVCAVGETLRVDPAIFHRAVTALADIPLRLVSQAAARRNITFVLRDVDVRAALMRLHDQFFGAGEPCGRTVPEPRRRLSEHTPLLQPAARHLGVQ
jgi:aspartate kinase